MKKFVVSVILLLIGMYVYTLQHEKKDTELKLESMAGHNLFLLLTTYDEIEKVLNSDKLNTESINDIEEKLVKIKEYSTIIDSIVSNDSLKLITNNWQVVFFKLEKNYSSTGSSEYKNKELNEIKNMIDELESIIYETYYVKDNVEGGKAELNINDFTKIEAYQKKMDEFSEQIINMH
ncbi:hypothetical protein E1B06_22070 [Brevibacillus laterosporus]|uniref:hypothetical protein n=1 Tax=Brevibacillus laterosporus TaxID=1465 RepID=UPI002406DEBB|nr:hypothetical protein [Brevibacillus laterosporus]MDF9414312.1 hypothetical protein [Brevibacillus laterosporus]